mmetsp:Transcript_55748/g.104914  ORF Transcript_55748/g.104914 Transcript_55748/m.104914 type:complete len:227 (-) Transcript_55748:588-1268(-)
MELGSCPPPCLTNSATLMMRLSMPIKRATSVHSCLDSLPFSSSSNLKNSFSIPVLLMSMSFCRTRGTTESAKSCRERLKQWSPSTCSSCSKGLVLIQELASVHISRTSLRSWGVTPQMPSSLRQAMASSLSRYPLWSRSKCSKALRKVSASSGGRDSNFFRIISTWRSFRTFWTLTWRSSSTRFRRSCKGIFDPVYLPSVNVLRLCQSLAKLPSASASSSSSSSSS